jgi:large repetitive protein
VEGDALTYSVVGDVTNGTLGSISDNQIIYTPTQDFNGTDTFTYKANDGTDDSNTATVTITVNAVNDTPVTTDQTASTNEDTAVDITLTSSDVEGDAVTYSIVSDVSNGTTSLSGATVTYTPTANWNGTDTFTFKANDGTSDSNTSTVTITVASVNDAPVANDVTASMDENKIAGRYQPVTITLDATDVEGDNLTYSVVGDVSNGTLGSISDNQIIYTPTQDFNGTDTFTYKANDGTADSNTATVTITINSVNDAPVTEDQSVSTDEDTAVDITLTSSDVEGDTITYSIVSDASNGTTSLSGATVTYTPTANYNGTDTFTFKANDGTVDSNTSTVTITVASVNDAPVANDVTASMDENKIAGRYQPVTITLDATDVEGDALTYSVVGDVTNGTLGSVSTNQIIYTPTQDFNGTDTFTYKANDGTDDSNTATVTITINSVNDAPVTTDQTASTDEDTAVEITLTSSDVEGDTVTYSIVSDVSNGTTSLSGTTVTYTPTANYNGTDTFTFKANDGTSDSNTSTVTITVASVNDAPVANNVTASTQSRTGNMLQAVTITLDATDVDGDDLTYSLVSDVSNGGTSLSGNEVTYTPNGGYDGTDTFTYKVNDGTADSNTATGTITSTPARTYVPDDVFEQYWEAWFTDVNDDYVDTYRMQNDQISLLQSNVADLTGIEDIPGLKILWCTWCSIESLDVSSNSNLIRIDVWKSEQLSSINFGENGLPNLEQLDINDTNISTIDLDKLPNLRKLQLRSPLTSVDVSENILLEELWVAGSTNFSTLDLSQNSKLSFLYIGGNATSIDCIQTPSLDTTYSGQACPNCYYTTDCSNARPEVSDISSSTDEDVVINITLNGTDEDGDTLTYTIVSDVSNGVTSLSGSTVTYTPTANWSGTDTFTFKANDGIVDSKTSTVTITVASVNDAPIANDMSLSLDREGSIDFTLDASDQDGDSLSKTIVSQPENGTLLPGTGLNYTYTPDSGYFGNDSFTYKVNDGTSDSDVKTVSFDIDEGIIDYDGAFSGLQYEDVSQSFNQNHLILIRNNDSSNEWSNIDLIEVSSSGDLVNSYQGFGVSTGFNENVGGGGKYTEIKKTNNGYIFYSSVDARTRFCDKSFKFYNSSLGLELEYQDDNFCIRDVIELNDGNLVAIGDNRDYISIYKDTIIKKINKSDGSIIWSYEANIIPNSNGYPQAVVVSEADNGNIVFTVEHNDASKVIKIGSLDANGNLLWTNSFENSNYVRKQLNIANNIYILIESDERIISYDKDGNLILNILIPTSYSWIEDMIYHTNNYLYISEGNSPGYNNKTTIYKYDLNGSLIWTRTYDVPSSSDKAHTPWRYSSNFPRLSETNDGNIMVLISSGDYINGGVFTIDADDGTKLLP